MDRVHEKEGGLLLLIQSLVQFRMILSLGNLVLLLFGGAVEHGITMLSRCDYYLQVWQRMRQNDAHEWIDER